MCMFSIMRGELAQQILLLIAELAWRHNDHSDMLISLACAAQTRNPFALEAEEGASLGAGRNLKLHFLRQGRDLDLVTQSGLCECKRNLA